MVHIPKMETENSVYLGHGVCGDRLHVCDTSCICMYLLWCGWRAVTIEENPVWGEAVHVHVLLDQLMVLHILLSLPISVKAASFGDAIVCLLCV